MDSVLVTGAAGFIGFHLALRLAADGRSVIGLDNLDPYYDLALKRARLAKLATQKNFHFELCDLADRRAIPELFATHRFRQVIHLGGQAGVRHSLVAPYSYADSNLIGFLNILEGCRQVECEHLMFASSSSVYGANTCMPLRTSDHADHPLSLYGASKRANELMAHSYAHLFGIPATALRFFTVYGPWGRPDMAIWLFTAAIMEGKPIRLFNDGKMRRDFTYIDDVTEAMARLLVRPPSADYTVKDRPGPTSSRAPSQIYNVGNSKPVELMEVVRVIEQVVGRPAIREFLPMQPGDVLETYADSSELERDIGFRPKTSIEDGIRRFFEWYTTYRRSETNQAVSS